jgi:hypothetical protein
MNRPALLLAAGLALSWWRRRPSAATEQEEVELPLPDASQTPDLADESVPVAAEIESRSVTKEVEIPRLKTASDSSFPAAPQYTDGSLVNAWDDLRAAIAPEAGKWIKVREPLRKLPEVVVQPEIDPIREAAAPAMPHFFVSLPSSPWIGAEDQEEEVPEADIHFIPRSAGPVNSDFMLPSSDLSEAPTEPLTRPAAVIVPEDQVQEHVFSEPVSAGSAAISLASSAILSEEVQSKKSFFDWLRS